MPTGACTSTPATSVRTAACKAAAASSAATPDAQFVNVPLDTPATQQPQPTTPRSPASSFLHKLSRSLFGGSGTGAAKGGYAPHRSGLATKAVAGSSQAVTPRIAAVGSGLSPAASLALEEQQAQCSAAADSHAQTGSSQVVDGFTKPLQAPGPLVELQRCLPQEQPAVGAATALDIATAHAPSAPCTASVASASVASQLPESDRESDSDSEEQNGSRAGAACVATAVQRQSVMTAQRQSAVSARRSDVFELVSLSSNSMTTSSAPNMA